MSDAPTNPSKHWWGWVWPFSKSSQQRVSPESENTRSEILPPKTPAAPPVSKQRLPPKSQSYPAVTKHNLQAHGTQTYSNEPNSNVGGGGGGGGGGTKGTPHGQSLLTPRKLKTMQKFPVDDDEFLVEEPSRTATSFFAEIVSEEEIKPLSEDDEEEQKNPPGLEIETDIFHTANPTSDPLYVPYGFIIMCFFQIIWGLVGVIQVAVLRYTKSLALTYVLLDRNFSDHSALYLLIGASLTTLGGICGLLALAFNIQFLLHLIPHFMWAIVTMCLCSSITARGNLERPTVPTYYRLFEAAGLHSQDPMYLKGSWPHIKPTIWHDMQKTMRCCGVENVTDWLYLPDHTIPDSCCLADLWHPCKTALKALTVGKNSPEDLIKSLDQVRKYLHDDTCVTVLTLERGNHIRDWTTYPLIYLAFHLLIMFNLNYLTQILIREHKSWQGQARLKLFKSQSIDLLKARMIASLLVMIPFCCKRMKDKARWEVEKQASHNVLVAIKKDKKTSVDSNDLLYSQPQDDGNIKDKVADNAEKSATGVPNLTNQKPAQGPSKNVQEWTWKKSS